MPGLGHILKNAKHKFGHVCHVPGKAVVVCEKLARVGIGEVHLWTRKDVQNNGLMRWLLPRAMAYFLSR